MSNVLLSVICTTYGHEKYIRKALDSILMQKVNFSMEVLIGEDCSPDNSRMILKEYEKNYPGFFTIFYREKNLGGAENAKDLRLHAKGKYIAYLELDDYWTDENKLQQQVDFLESHKDVFAVAHRTVMVDKKDTLLNQLYPECHRKYYTWHHYVRGLLPGQMATIVRRNERITNIIGSEVLNDDSFGPGDRKTAFFSLCNGKVLCIQKVMSAYRYVTDEGTSFTAKRLQTSKSELYEKTTSLYRGLLKYARLYFDKSAIISSEKMYVSANVGEKRENGENWLHYLLFDLDVKYKMRVRLYFGYIILRRVRIKIKELFQ